MHNDLLYRWCFNRRVDKLNRQVRQYTLLGYRETQILTHIGWKPLAVGVHGGELKLFCEIDVDAPLGSYAEFYRLKNDETIPVDAGVYIGTVAFEDDNVYHLYRKGA